MVNKTLQHRSTHLPEKLSPENKIQKTTISEGNKIAVLFEYHSYAELWGRTESENVITEIKLTLLAIIKKLGITNLPDQSAMNELAKYVMKYYADFNSKEMLYAFELYSTQRLSTPDFKSSFNSFNTILISLVLNGYRDIRNKKIREKAKKEEQEKEEKMNNMTPEQADAYAAKMYQIVLDYINEYRKMPITANWLACYHHMKKNSMLKVLDATEQKAYIDRAFEEAKNRDIQKIANGMPFEGDEEVSLKNNEHKLYDACRTLRVKDHFKDLIFYNNNNSNERQANTQHAPDDDF